MPFSINAGCPMNSAPLKRIFLFSGHMIDAPGRALPRFPAELEPAVNDALAKAIDRFQAGPGDLALCGAACGGDLLFAALMLERQSRLRIYLPLDEPAFIAESVAYAGARWVERYHQVTAQSALVAAPDVLGPLGPGEDPFERCNLWMLDAARHAAGSEILFLCLWDGQRGDGPGGTQHMMDAVRASGGTCHWIDIRRLAPAQ
jgi:hypothetical protein